MFIPKKASNDTNFFLATFFMKIWIIDWDLTNSRQKNKDQLALMCTVVKNKDAAAIPQCV